MKTRLISLAAAAAVALSSVAAPAVASDRIVQRNILLGLGALAIIGAATADQNRRNGNVERHDNRWDGDRWDDDRWDGRRDDRRWRNSLPIACQFRVNTRDGSRQVLGSNCLEQYRVATHRLPNQCEFTIRTNRGPRDVFGSHCLERSGYRIEARR